MPRLNQTRENLKKREVRNAYSSVGETFFRLASKHRRLLLALAYSSSNFSNGVWEWEREYAKLWILLPFQAKYIIFLRQNSAQPEEKSCGKMKGRRGNETTREKPGCHGRGYHHGPCWTPRLGCGAHWRGVFRFPTPLRFGALFWFAGFCLGSSVLGLLGLFCWLCWLELAYYWCLSPNTWFDISTSVIKNPNKAKPSVIGEIWA